MQLCSEGEEILGMTRGRVLRTGVQPYHEEMGEGGGPDGACPGPETAMRVGQEEKEPWKVRSQEGRVESGPRGTAERG